MNKKIHFVYRCYKSQNIVDFLHKKHYSDKNIFYLILNKNITINNNYIRDKQAKIPFFAKIKVTLNDEDCKLGTCLDKLEIIYEDNYVLVANKPAGMDVEPTRKNFQNNLSACVHQYYKENQIKSNIHLVNRLDKLTSGLVIFAKNQYIHHLFQSIKIHKYYFAEVEGKTKKRGCISLHLKKDSNTTKRIVSNDGKACLTKFKRVRYQNNRSVVKIKLLTGRTHQIRVSFAHVNHPLIGDPLYNLHYQNGEKMKLCCYKICFFHPLKKKWIILNIKP